MPVITKNYTFEAAHILTLPYESKCRQLHGHSYAVTVEIEHGSLNDQGMVLDYSAIPDVVTPLDHKLIVTADKVQPMSGTRVKVIYDTQIELICEASAIYQLPVPIPNSTAECIADYLLSVLEEALDANGLVYTSLKVTVKETAKTSASATVAN